MSKTTPVSIGNGLFAQTRVLTSLMDDMRARQAACLHVNHDPRGMCYSCGKTDATKVRPARLAELIAADPNVNASFRALFCPDTEAHERAVLRSYIASAKASDIGILILCNHGLLTECAACIQETAL